MERLHLPVITIESLCYRYRSSVSEALSTINLQINEGELIAILGHNGAGKTTLLRCIYGTLIPYKGTVSISRKAIPSYSDIFFHGTDFALNRYMTISENLRFRSELLNKRQLAEQQTDLQIFNLERYSNVKTGKLSSGLYHRAGLAVGLSTNPRLIMLDEPTNTIDPCTYNILLSDLSRRKSLGCTIVLSTHDLNLAHTIADRCFVLQNGYLLEELVPKNYATAEDFRQKYLELAREDYE